jgi:hypothetical protein
MTTDGTTDTAGPGYEPPAIDHREALTGLLAPDTIKSDPPRPCALFT